MKPFLMMWNSAQAAVWQQQILDYLDTRPEIKNWFTPFLGTILLVADLTQNASTLANIIHPRFPELIFAITPADVQMTNGWMPQVFWDLIRTPKGSGRWPEISNIERRLADTLASLYETAGPHYDQAIERPDSVTTLGQPATGATLGDILRSLKK